MNNSNTDWKLYFILDILNLCLVLVIAKSKLFYPQALVTQYIYGRHVYDDVSIRLYKYGHEQVKLRNRR